MIRVFSMVRVRVWIITSWFILWLWSWFIKS